MPGGLTEMCFPVIIVNDTVPENCLETFSVGIASSDTPIGTPNMIEIEVFDDDGKLDDF